MKGSKAFDLVCRTYDLKIVDIANKSGVNKETLSRYRNEKRDITSENLLAVLKNLPIEARNLFIGLISGEIHSLPIF